VETPLRSPDVSQDKYAADSEKDVAGYLTISQGLGQVMVGCLQVSVRQSGQPQERGCRSAPQMVSLRQEVECPPGVFHGAGTIAESLGNIGSGFGYRSRERPKLFFVRDDHLGQ
jgi:hypothetical protein